LNNKDLFASLYRCSIIFACKYQKCLGYFQKIVIVSRLPLTDATPLFYQFMRNAFLGKTGLYQSSKTQ